MSRPRLLLSVLLLLLAATALLLFYGHRNLETLATAQLQQRLSGFGIEQLTLENIQLGRRQLTLESLQLAGESAGLRFHVTFTNVRIRYSAASLLALEVSNAHIGDLKIAVTQGNPPAQSSSTAPVLHLSDWLAQPINASLPLTSLSLPSIELSYRSGQQEPVVLTGSVHVSEALALDLSGAFAGEPFAAHLSVAEGKALMNLNVGDGSPDGFLRCSLTLTPAGAPRPAQHWQAALALHAEHTPLQAWLAQSARTLYPAGSATLPGALTLSGESALQASAVLPDTLPLDDIAAGRLPADLSINATLDTQLQALHYADDLQDMSGQLTLTLQHAAAHWHTRVSGYLQGRLGATGLPAPTLTSLEFDQGLPFSLTLADGRGLGITLSDSGARQWEARLENAELLVGDTRNRLQATALTAQAQGSGTSATKIRLSSDLDMLLQGRKLPRLVLNADQTGPPGASAYRISLADGAQDISLTLSGNADVTSGQGKHTLDVHIIDMAGASASVAPLMTRFGLVARSPEINAGRLRLTSRIDTDSFDRNDWRQHATLTVEGVSGLWNDIAFDGLSMDAAWQGIEAWKTTKPLRLGIAMMQPGFRISDIDASLSLPEPTPIDRPSVVVERFSANLFGGRVVLQDDSRWDFGADRNSLTLRAENWSLAELVALQQNRSIQAQGELSGELPLTVTGQRITIDGGSLRSQPPGGTIRYQPDAATASMGSGSSELNMALELLRDFHFETLMSSVHLDDTGQLTLGLALSGRNPSQQAGRPVNFNINVQQNIDPLLQSLRLGDTLVKEFEEGLR